MISTESNRERISIGVAIAGVLLLLWLVKILYSIGLLPPEHRGLLGTIFSVIITVGLVALWRKYTRASQQAAIVQRLLSQSPDCLLILTEQGTILGANTRCRDVLGYDAAELRLCHLRSLVHPDERRAIGHLLGQLLAAGNSTTVRVILHLLHRTTRPFPAELAATLETFGRRRYILLSIRDISEQVRQERKIRRVLHTLDRIMRTIPEAVLIFDVQKRRFVYAGNARVLGWNPIEMTRLDFDGFCQRLHPADRQQLERCMQEATTLHDGGTLTCLYRMSDSDGRWRWYYSRVALFKRSSDGRSVEQLLLVTDDITALMEERAARERLHQRMQLATRGAGIGVWEIELRTLLPTWDDTMYLLHGIAPSVEGKALLRQWRHGIHRTHLRAMLSELRTLIRHGQGQFVATYDFFTPTGERKHFRAVATLVHSPSGEGRSLIGIVVDETLLVEQQRQQQKLQHLLEESQRMARMASWEIEPDTQLLTVTSELWNILGVPPPAGAVNFRQYQRNIHPEDRERWIQTIEKAIISAQSYLMRYRIVRSDGQVRWMQCHGEPVVCKGKVVLLRGTVQDITEQYEQEQELIRTREEALRASRVKSEFLANMSHEIRTPMNAILGFASLLEKAVTDPLLREYITAIQSGGRTLLQLINDILDLSKLEAGKMRLSPEPTELKTFIEEVRMFLAERASSKGIELRTELVGTLPTAIELDTVRMRQILFNLLGNAIKFTDRGWVTLRVFGSPNEDGTWRLIFEVEDTGIGIPADQLDAIFEAFQQVEGQSTRKYGGTGLGLSICKRLTELMGGQITVRSTVGSGSVFTVTLPRMQVASIEGIPERSSVALPQVSFDGAVVVVVDDVESNRALLRSYLEHHDAVVHEAASADDAERLITMVEPHAVFTDIQMPERSGIDLARSLRGTERWRTLPLVAVTATPIANPEHAALFDSVLLKPVTLEAFLHAACKILPYHQLDGQVPQDEPDEPDQLPDLDGEVRSHLESIAATEWKAAIERFSSADIERFVAALERAESLSSHAAVRRYREQVQAAYEQFDIPRLRSLLERFAAFVTHTRTEQPSKVLP
ncbi:MAG: hypothetical protein KatS3mg038_0855 [Candidatus Kapaibacterium sp.]|nr:MAG: hypothetical protein KatS3mg038_0855 [Candidatus Kapabacteria bacterium]